MKKLIYIFSWIILGFLLSMLAHAGIEVWYIMGIMGSDLLKIQKVWYNVYLCFNKQDLNSLLLITAGGPAQVV